MPPLVVAGVYLLAVNAVAFIAFAWDKHCARNDLRRIPERTLLALAAIGGSSGAIAGQRLLRHKTRKQPFRTYLQLLVAAQIVAIFALALVPSLRTAAWDALIAALS